MAFVPVDAEAAALATVAHLGVLDRDAAVPGDAPPHGRRPIGRTLDILVADPIDLGAEFVRWEVATAIAGAVLGVNAFDQPNVEESKELTRQLLDRSGDEPSGQAAHDTGGPLIADGDLAFHPDAAMRLTAGDGTLAGELSRHLARRRPGA